MTPGQNYDRYKIIRELGGGSMGKVYLAVREDTGQQIALKIVNGGDSPEAMERIAVEKGGAELHLKLSSNGLRDARVVKVQRIFQIGPDLAIEMEYVEGEDLYKILRRGRLEPKRAAAIGISLCEMITNLARTIVHGDLKPSNVLIMREDQVKVIDFGIAKEMEKAKNTTYNPYQSAAYSSPERLRTARVDANSDLWSVGVMLYEMVAGRRPFGANDEDLLARIQGGPDPLPANVPQPLGRVLFKMLAWSPSQRYGNAADCVADLRRFLAGQPVTAPDPSEATRRTGAPADSEATRRTTPVQPAAGQRKDLGAVPKPVAQPWKWAGAVKLGLFSALLLAVIFFISGQYNMWNDADELQRRLATRKMAPGDAWTPWQDIHNRSRFTPLVYGLRRTLQSQLIESTDEVIQDYRHDQPTTHESDWSRALSNIQHALELDPNDKTLTARLEICEAHLLRTRAHGPTKVKSLYSAIAKFEAAAKVMPEWRDPYLGLARIYLYDLGEFDKGMEMINEAVKRGHPAGKRERAQIADALRGRGLRLLDESRQFADMPDQQKQYLERARDDFRNAAQYYSEVGDFTRRAPALRKEMLQRLQIIEDRLAGK